MKTHTLRVFATSLSALHRSQKAAQFAAGIGAGACLSTCLTVFQGAWGISLPVETGLCLALLLGVAVGVWCSGLTDRAPQVARQLWPLPALLAAAFAAPHLARWTIQLTQLPESGPLVRLTAVCQSALAATLIVGIPCAFCVSLSRTARGTTNSLCYGVAAGIAAHVLLVAPLLGTTNAALAVIGVSAILPVAQLFGPRVGTDRSSATTHEIAAKRGRLLVVAIAAGGVGVIGAVLFRLVANLMPVALWMQLIVIAVIIAGAACGLGRRSAQTAGFPTGNALLFLSCVAAVVAAYDLLIHLTLSMNAYLANAYVHVACRMLLLALVLTPLSYHAGRFTSRLVNRSSPLWWLVPLTVGYLACRWLLLPAFGPYRVLFVTVAILFLALAARTIRRRERPVGRLGWLAATAACGVLVAAPFLSRRDEHCRAAKLLFDTNYFFAFRNGTPYRLLPHLDDARRIETVEGEGSTFTLWRQHGAQLVVRRNGIPIAVTSEEPGVFPCYAAEVLQSVLPLTLHASPERVLVLGVGSGTQVDTCLGFPIRALTVADGDQQAVKLFARIAALNGSLMPDDDERARWLPLDAPLALQAGGPAFDVIVDSGAENSIAAAACRFTGEYYGHVAGRLTENGIFCQRFRHVDLGAEPVETALRTLFREFTHAAAIQTDSGEFLLLATNAPDGLIQGDILARWQRPQVQAALASAGWDWTVPLNLTGYGRRTLLDTDSDRTPAPHNNLGNSIAAVRNPLEVIAWSDKAGQKSQWSAGKARAAWLLDNLPEEVKQTEAFRDVAHRTEEVASQRRLMSTIHDDWWRYRAVLKQRVSTRPRSVIQQVGGSSLDRQLHPVDRKRLDYVQALGKAAGGGQPRIEEIESFETFTNVYDPLFSFYIHHELAELYAQAATPRPGRELRHRLHTVFFASGADHSVHNVTTAIELLVDHPDAEPDDQRRFDLLSGLIQILKQRWDLRRAVTPDSVSSVIRDVDASVQAVTDALEALEALHTQLGRRADDWRKRRLVVERHLLRPLRVYRTTIINHHDRQMPLESEPMSADDESKGKATADER